MVILKTKTGLIPANETEVIFTDVDIENDSIIEVYYDSNDVYTLETWQSGDSVHIITSAHSNPVGVKLLINNVTSFSPYDDTNVKQRVSTLENDIVTIEQEVEFIETNLSTIQSAVTSLNTETENLREDMSALETQVDGLNASNIMYDDSSTLYSAMGDIDSLETTSKNLVGAINEVKETGGGGGGGGYQPNYTTTEKQVGTFVNGKPIYGRIFSLGSHSWASQSSTRLTEIKVNAEDIIRFFIFGNQSGTRLFYNWACNNDSMASQGLATYNLRTTSVNFSSGYAYMEYTKK